VADFTASSTSISVGDSVTFTDTSTNTPTSWSWTFAGGTPGSSTAQNPTITYNTEGTFDVSLTAANAQGSDNETKVGYINVTLQPYCASQGTTYNEEWIAGVEVGTMNNTSGSSGYSDFTAITCELTADSLVNVVLTPDFNGGPWTEYWKIWIDYNGDQDFEDAGEEVFSGSGTSTVTGSFTVGSVTTTTRMRVTMKYNAAPTPCETFSYGEVEDYTANITGACTQYTLTTNTVGNGSISLNPAGGTYCEGTVVTLTAIPDAGWQFDNWSGDLTGSTNPDTITMNSNKSVTATFSQLPVEQYSLTVNTVGQGSVTLNPPGGVYDDGTVVTLTANADSGWQFSSWSGDLTGSTNPDTITMNANKTVTATFTEVGNCSEIVGHNTVFSLSTTTANRRAMPFTMPENGEICSVTMYHNGGSGSMIMGVYDGESLPANRLGVTASTAVSGSTGWQTIDLTSPAFVASGAKIWLAWVYQSNPGMYYETGSPGRAHSSQTWSGGMPDPFGSSTTASYIYSIYANYTPSAPPQYTLTTNVVGNGSVALNPPGGIYDAGTVVTLTATPDSGWLFSSWSGDLSGSTNPTTITMNSNKNVTATFIEEGTTGNVGNETAFGSTSVSGNRRAMPFTMPEDGTITSVTMYHTGGSGSMILGVYDGASTPQNRLGVTATTALSGSTGWQTINLTGSAFVSGGATVWLAWVYESNPGIRYQTGSPGRYQSTATWSGGMPDPFGSGSQTTYIYSIYATYNK
jgi:PKD repeat protein